MSGATGPITEEEVTQADLCLLIYDFYTRDEAVELIANIARGRTTAEQLQKDLRLMLSDDGEGEDDEA